MKNKTGIGWKLKGKTAVVPAVFTMVVMTTAVVSGCQSTADESVSGQITQAESETELSGMEQSSAGQSDMNNKSSVPADTGEDTNAQANVKGQETQPEQNDIQTPPEENENQVGSERESVAGKEPPAGWELTLASEDWGLSFGESGTQPVGNALPQDLAWYDAYYVGADNEKVIYLTFDCGYENGNTEPILDALKKHDVQATFFVVGHFLETAPDMVKRMVEEGHAVGNHTYHHLDMPTISDKETFQKEMDDVADLFHEITGAKLSPYYRPPQGKCNVNNLKMAQESGYNTIFWSLAYVDWDQDNQPGHTEALDKLTTRIHPGAIVLLHNTSSTNGEILDELLTKWEEMGYTFRPLAELVS